MVGWLLVAGTLVAGHWLLVTGVNKGLMKLLFLKFSQ
jgi:hypothetical protein